MAIDLWRQSITLLTDFDEEIKNKFNDFQIP